MDFETLLDAAIANALETSEIATGLRVLDDADQTVKKLARVAQESSATIRQAVADELRRVEEARAAFDAAYRSALAELSVENDDAAQVKEFESQLKEIRASRYTLTRDEAQLREQLELKRTQREIASAWRAGTEAVARATDEALPKTYPTRRRGQGVEDDDATYQAGLERLELVMKAVADVVTAEQTVRDSLDRVKHRVVTRMLAEATADARIAVAQAQLDAARREALQAMMERGVLPVWRGWLNERLEREHHARYLMTLDGATATGLAELPTPAHVIATDAGTQLARLVESLPGGSVGISGPRGVGKTTLIRSLCGPGAHQHEVNCPTLMVSAPVNFAPLDFVLHLGERVCRTLLGPGADAALDQTSTTVDAVESRAARQRGRLLISGSLLGALVLGIGVARAIHALGQAHLSGGRQQALIAGGIAVMAIAMAAPPRARMSYEREVYRWLSNHVRVVSRRLWRTAMRLTAVSAATGYAMATLLAPRESWGPSSWSLILLAAFVPLFLAALNLRQHSAWPLPLIGAIVAATALAVAAFTGTDLGAVGEVGAAAVCVGCAVVRLSFPLSRWIGRSSMQIVRTVASLGLVLVVYGLGLIALGWLARSPDAELAVAVGLALVGGTVLELTWAVRVPAFWGSETDEAAAVMLPRSIPGAEEASAREVKGVLTLALALLRRIRYQRTFESGWGTKVGLSAAPITAEASSTGRRSSAEQAMTLPQAVDQLRDLLSAAATLSGKVLIGIDEVDKMASADDAERFVNDIKAIFGIPGCYFLISVSEDAVAAFERRGMPFRDVFDSAFDDVIRVDHLDLVGTERLLDARTLEMPLPFKALCHSLAGGLPRDVIRLARHVFAARVPNRQSGLGVVTRTVVAGELRAKRDGTVTALVALASRADVGSAVTWLADRPLTTQYDAFSARLDELPPPAGSSAKGNLDQHAVDRLVRELAAYWYLCVTLAEFFTDDRAVVDLELADRSTDQGGIHQLARARQALAIDPALAWVRISAFRHAWQFRVAGLGEQDRAAAARGEGGSHPATRG